MAVGAVIIGRGQRYKPARDAAVPHQAARTHARVEKSCDHLNGDGDGQGKLKQKITASKKCHTVRAMLRGRETSIVIVKTNDTGNITQNGRNFDYNLIN